MSVQGQDSQSLLTEYFRDVRLGTRGMISFHTHAKEASHAWNPEGIYLHVNYYTAGYLTF